MAWKIEWSPGAFSSLEKLEKKESARIVEKIEAAAANPRHFLERLSGHDESKLRFGDYRVIVLLLHSTQTLFVEQLDHRKKVYKKKS
jgi:mRNA-degrading endonuclease RelE of RelBE toxin-antitoxin system